MEKKIPLNTKPDNTNSIQSQKGCMKDSEGLLFMYAMVHYATFDDLNLNGKKVEKGKARMLSAVICMSENLTCGLNRMRKEEIFEMRVTSQA